MMMPPPAPPPPLLPGSISEDYSARRMLRGTIFGSIIMICSVENYGLIRQHGSTLNSVKVFSVSGFLKGTSVSHQPTRLLPVEGERARITGPGWLQS